MFLFDWHGLPINDIGNTLAWFTRILATGALSGRATFSKRNVRGCGESQATAGRASATRLCVSDPGHYFFGGSAWAASPANNTHVIDHTPANASALGAHRGLAPGFVWAWTPGVEDAVRGTLSEQGVAEEAYTLGPCKNPSPSRHNTSPRCFFRRSTGERLAGVTSLPAFLAHPEVAAARFVSLIHPPPADVPWAAGAEARYAFFAPGRD